MGHTLAELVRAIESGAALTDQQRTQVLRWLRWSEAFYSFAAILRSEVGRLEADDPAAVPLEIAG